MAREAFVFYDPKLKRIKLVEKKWLVENVLGRMSLSSIYSRGDLTHQKDSTFSTKRTRFFFINDMKILLGRKPTQTALF